MTRLDRATRSRLALLAVVGASAIAYAGARYAGVVELVHPSTYNVTVDLKESGGIFDGAEVTYRGYTVGRVRDIEFRRDGITLRATVHRDLDVPRDVTATVRNRSAVGEQYLDLVPERNASAMSLRGGDVIDESHTNTPVPEEQVLQSLDRLITSVDTGDVETVLYELSRGLQGGGDDIARLIDGTHALLQTTEKMLPDTISLIRNGRTVLQTQAEQADQIRSSLADLRTVSKVLADHDDDVRTILRDAPKAARETTALVTSIEHDLSALLDNLLTTNRIVRDRLTGLEQALVAIPLSLASAQTPGIGGLAHFTLALTQAPAPCRVGYPAAKDWRDPADTRYIPPADSIGCQEGLPSLPRGANHAPGPSR